jgi:predicted dehydrogenase
MLRLALIGCGEHAEGSHAVPLARYVSEHPGELSLVAACDLRAERAEEFCHKYGFARAYREMDEMIARESVDACVSVMPMERITEVGIKLLTMKIPCVIEKPLGVSLADVEHLAEVARETGTPHMVSVNRRFMPYLNRAVDWAREAGALRYVRGTMCRHQRGEADFIWSTALHVVDTLRYIAGEIRDYQAVVQEGTATSPRWYSISVRFESDAIGHVEVLPTTGMWEESYELFGDGFRASVLSRLDRPAFVQCWRGNEIVREEAADADEPQEITSGAYGEVIEFVQSLKTKFAPRPTIEDVLPSVALCFRIAEEVSNGRSGF